MKTTNLTAKKASEIRFIAILSLIESAAKEGRRSLDVDGRLSGEEIAKFETLGFHIRAITNTHYGSFGSEDYEYTIGTMITWVTL